MAQINGFPPVTATVVPEAGQRIGEHDVGGRELGRLPCAFHRQLLAEVRDRFVWHGRGNERRPNRAWCDRIYPNAFRRQLAKPPAKSLLAYATTKGAIQKIGRFGSPRQNP